MFKLLKLAGRIVLGRHEVLGMEYVAENRRGVFVCNHDGAYGPVAMVLFFPFRFKPWVIYNTTVKGCVGSILRTTLSLLY